MNEYTSPYNAVELARAKTALSHEMDKDVYRFLRKRMEGLARTDRKFSKNLWEGPDGRMEHIKSNFPMPRKAGERQSSSDLSQSCSSSTPSQDNSSSVPLSTPSSARGPQQNVSNSSPSPQTDNSDDSSSDELSEGELVEPSPPRTSSQPTPSKNKVQQNAPGSKSDSCLLNSNRSKEFIANSHSNTNNDSDSVSQHNLFQQDLSCVSEVEQQHWIRLRQLQQKVHSTGLDLRTVKVDFRKSKQDKACSQMESLHWKIHGYISQLTSERQCRDNHDFELIPANKVKPGKEFSISKNIPQSYGQAWLSLKRLCVQFGKVWKRHKSLLSDSAVLGDAPKSKMLSRLKKIVLS